MDQEPILESLAGCIYDAAVDPELWSGTIARIADAVGCRSGIFYEHDISKRQSRPLGFHDLDPAFMLEYERHYAALDPWNKRVLAWPPGVVAPTYTLIADAELRRTEFYQDHLRHSGVFYGLGGVVDRTRGRMAVFGVQCRYEDGRFSPEACDLVGKLMPHLRRAYHLHRTLDQARRDRETLEEALHAVRQPVLVVEADGRLLFANQEAKRLLAMEDGVKLSAGCVVAAHRADRPALAALLRPMDPASGDTVIAALRRPGRQRPLLIEAMPLRQRGRWEPPSRVVLLIDSRAMQRPAPEDLAGLYDLTPAEARLWSGLAGGATLAEIAVRHRVSVNTLRVQLGRLFRKVGVHRQADLVRRALEFTGPRDDPGVPEPRRE